VDEASSVKTGIDEAPSVNVGMLDVGRGVEVAALEGADTFADGG
jgi:hypothetical protein